MKKSSALMVVCLATITASAADYSKEIAEVKSGNRTEAMASWWGFDRNDSTNALKSALNSGAKKIVVENMGADWITGSLSVPSNIEVIFHDGVVVKAKKGEFKAPREALFRIEGRENVTLRGIGKVLFLMNKQDYQDQANYTQAEWRHTVGILESDNVTLDNLTLKASGGDGIYIGSYAGRKDCSNVRLANLVSEDHYRQGLSVCGVKNLSIRNCKFNNTSGTLPECGLDFEPNWNRALQNIVIEDCEFNDNKFLGICLSNNSHLPTTITIRNCLIRGNKSGGIGLGHTAMGEPKSPGKIEFINCRVEGNKVSSISLGFHAVSNLKLIFRDCVIDNRKADYSAMVLASESSKDIYGLEIQNLTVIDDANRPPIVFNSKYGNALIDPVVENVVVKNSKGDVKKFDCEKFIRESAPNPAAKAFKVMPVERPKFAAAFKKGKTAGTQIRFRENTDYFVYAKEGDKIKIKFTNAIVHKADVKPLEITVSTPTVPNYARLEIPFEGSLDYTLDARENGIYKFAIAARGQTVTVECEAPGQAFGASDKLYVFGCPGTLYFAVPSGIETVVLEVGGVLREESNAALIDPTGNVVAEEKNLAGSRLLTYTRNDSSHYEIWGVKFNASKLFLRLKAPVPQIFSTSPANVLVEKNETGKYSLEVDPPIQPVVKNGDFKILEPSRKTLF